NFKTSTSTAISQTILAGKATMTTLAASTTTPVFGQPVALTATVVASGAVPTGTVTFFEGATNLGTVALNTLRKAVLFSGFSLASHTVFARYNGLPNAFVARKSSSVPLTAGKASTTAIVASPTPSVIVGSAITFTTSVTPTAPGSGTPTGQVVFKVDG